RFARGVAPSVARGSDAVRCRLFFDRAAGGRAEVPGEQHESARDDDARAELERPLHADERSPEAHGEPAARGGGGGGRGAEADLSAARGGGSEELHARGANGGGGEVEWARQHEERKSARIAGRGGEQADGQCPDARTRDGRSRARAQEIRA